MGSKCVQAHSDAELHEWRARFEYRQERLQRAKESNLQCNTWAEQLLQEWISADNPDTVVSTCIIAQKHMVGSVSAKESNLNT